MFLGHLPLISRAVGGEMSQPLLDRQVPKTTHTAYLTDKTRRQRELADAEAKEIQRTCRCGECGSKLLMPWEQSVGHHVIRCPNGHNGPWLKEYATTKIVSGVRINMSTGQEIAQNQETRIVKWQTTYHGQVETTLAEVRARFCPKATDNEIAVFAAYCAAYSLNPYAKEVYLIKYQDGENASIVIGKDAYIKHAQANEAFQSMKAGCICLDKDGVMHHRQGMAYPQDTLIGGWARVERSDRTDPNEIEVDLKNYDTGRFLWKSHKSDMIRKVALVQCLRESFPTGMDRPTDPELPVAIEGDVVEGIIVELGEAVTEEPESVSAPPKPQPTPPPRTPKPTPPSPAQVRRSHADTNKLCEEHNRSWGAHPTTGQKGHPLGDGTDEWCWQQVDSMVDQLEKDFDAQG